MLCMKMYAVHLAKMQTTDRNSSNKKCARAHTHTQKEKKYAIDIIPTFAQLPVFTRKKFLF